MIRFCLIVIVTMAFSCRLPNNGFKKGIEQYLSANLRDFSTYEPIEYETPKILYSDINDDPKFHELMYAFEKVQTRQGMDSINLLMDSIRWHFVAEPVGYSIKHSYWEKDYVEKKIKRRKEFAMDLDFKVIDVVNLDPNKGK